MSDINNGNESMRFVTFIVTQNCNLNCTYCYEHNKTKNCFDVELAKKIILDELNIDDEYTEICFDFFGGEPFLEFEKIKEIVEYFKNKKFNKKVYFFAGTNGTLINKDIQDWLLKNRDIFQIALSLDGTRDMHNVNRSNSYDKIPVRFFAEKFQYLSVKATISPATIDTLADGIVHLHKLGFKNVSCNLAVGVDWSLNEYSDILERELGKLINFYLENPNIKPCNLLNYQIQNAVHPAKGKAIKFCGAGTRTKVYDIDGKIYPCQYFLPLTIGDKASKPIDVKFSDVINIQELDPKCQKCIAVNICPSCYGSNYQETGNIHKKDDDFCRLQKIIILANTFFKAKQWELGQLKLNDYKEQELLRSIILIQDEFGKK